LLLPKLKAPRPVLEDLARCPLLPMRSNVPAPPSPINTALSSCNKGGFFLFLEGRPRVQFLNEKERTPKTSSPLGHSPLSAIFSLHPKQPSLSTEPQTSLPWTADRRKHQRQRKESKKQKGGSRYREERTAAVTGLPQPPTTVIAALPTPPPSFLNSSSSSHTPRHHRRKTGTCTSTQAKETAARHCPTLRTAHHLLPSRSNTTRNRALPLHRHQLPLPSQSTTAPWKTEGGNENRGEQN